MVVAQHYKSPRTTHQNDQDGALCIVCVLPVLGGGNPLKVGMCPGTRGLGWWESLGIWNGLEGRESTGCQESLECECLCHTGGVLVWILQEAASKRGLDAQEIFHGND